MEGQNELILCEAEVLRMAKRYANGLFLLSLNPDAKPLEVDSVSLIRRRNGSWGLRLMLQGCEE